MACDTLSPTFYCRFMLLVPLFGSNIEPATLAITSTTAFLLPSNFLLFYFSFSAGANSFGSFVSLLEPELVIKCYSPALLLKSFRK